MPIIEYKYNLCGGTIGGDKGAQTCPLDDGKATVQDLKLQVMAKFEKYFIQKVTNVNESAPLDKE
ncbi:hypothetical protein GGI08_002942, partial [Coemansia sp. S2]